VHRIVSVIVYYNSWLIDRYFPDCIWGVLRCIKVRSKPTVTEILGGRYFFWVPLYSCCLKCYCLLLFQTPATVISLLCFLSTTSVISAVSIPFSFDTDNGGSFVNLCCVMVLRLVMIKVPFDTCRHVSCFHCTVIRKSNVVDYLDNNRMFICRVPLVITLWCPLLPYGYSYKASCARPG